MTIKVLLAGDSDVLLQAMSSTLHEDDRIEVVGEASSFAETVRMIGDYKPSVLVLDLHLPAERDLTSTLIKSQLAAVPHTLAVSFSGDNEAKALAESYGAKTLLNKMTLYSELIPTIVGCTSAALIC